jgi:hypothetical protein
MLEEPQPFGPNHPAPIIPCAVPTKPVESEPDEDKNEEDEEVA